jgi:hypothetical protein
MKKSRGTPTRRIGPVTARITSIRARIGRIDHISSGTLHKRMKVCGKSSCRCATDIAARHGPYYEWSWMEAGRLVHRVISPQQASLLLRAMRNYKEVKRLLVRWDEESFHVILKDRS